MTTLRLKLSGGSTRRVGSQPLWVAKHSEALRKSLHVCCECGKPLPKKCHRNRRWCGKACVDAYLIRAQPGYARKLVFRRDRGVCCMCQLDTFRVQHEAHGALIHAHEAPTSIGAFKPYQGRSAVLYPVLRKYGLQRWWKRKSWWDMDHILPIADGGGECDLSNLRTLCLKCHQQVTTAWRQRRGKVHGPPQNAPVRLRLRLVGAPGTTTAEPNKTRYTIRLRRGV